MRKMIARHFKLDFDGIRNVFVALILCQCPWAKEEVEGNNNERPYQGRRFHCSNAAMVAQAFPEETPSLMATFAE